MSTKLKSKPKSIITKILASGGFGNLGMVVEAGLFESVLESRDLSRNVSSTFILSASHIL